MKITSTAFKHNKMIPKKYTCEGEDVNPPLSFSEIPNGTKSLALIMHDHDGAGGDFVHWIVWNLDPKVSEIKEGWMPVDAKEGENDVGKPGWIGPCPVSDKHRYEFRLYALDSILDLPLETVKVGFREEIQGKILAEASLLGLYEKVAP